MFTQLNVKTVLFQTSQFSTSTQFSSIWPIDRTLSDALTLAQKRVLCIPQSITIGLFCVISRTLIGGGLTFLQRCSQCILQCQPTGPEKPLEPKSTEKEQIVWYVTVYNFGRIITINVIEKTLEMILKINATISNEGFCYFLALIWQNKISQVFLSWPGRPVP